MSGAEFERAGGSGVDPLLSHTTGVETDSRVYVDDIRIPVGDIELLLRKEGPADITRYAEGYFASPFQGEDYASAFDGLTPSEQDEFDTIRIEIKDHLSDDYNLAFRGIATGVGNASDGPEERWHFRAQGPGLLCDKIEASAKFTDASGEDVLEYVRERLDEKLPFDVTIEVGDDSDVEALTIGETTARLAPVLGGAAKIFSTIATSKTFQSNKHTLADVLNWFSEKTGVRVWIEPTPDGVGFVATDNPTGGWHRAHYLDPIYDFSGRGNDSGPHKVAVANNDAYVELKPANTLVLKGDAKKSLASVGPFELNEPQDQYSVVKARHQPLYERAGQRELRVDTDILSDAESKAEMENEARNLLKKAIDESTGGDMQTLLAAPIKPYDRIEALPTCKEQTAVNMEPITYEISRVHHEIKASGISQTTLNVGIHTAMDDIETVDSWEKEA